MEHAEFDAKVARALRSTGRMVRSAHGEVVGAQTGPVGCYDEHAPYTLSDPAPLTDEQAKAAAKAAPGWELDAGPGKVSLRYNPDGDKWERFDGSVPGRGWHCIEGEMPHPENEFIFRRPGSAEKATLSAAESMDAIECEEHAGVPAEEHRPDEDEPVTFGLRAAQAAWLAHYGDHFERQLLSGHWVPTHGQPALSRPHRFAPHYQPTAEQVSAIVKAEPERLCANDGEGDGELDYAMWDGERWTFFDGDTRTGNPDRGPRSTFPWRLALRPDYKPDEERESITVESDPQDVHVTLSSDETDARVYVNGRLFVPSEDDPEPQDTLAACMRWCDDRDVDAVARRHPKYESFVDCRILSGDLHSAGLAARDLEATDWQLSTDDGATWFSPSKGPEVEPRSGAELRRWLVSNPGRKALVGEHASKPTWWDRQLCDFYTEDGPASVDDDMSGKPLTGTWESEGE